MQTMPLMDPEFQLLLSMLPQVHIQQGPWITGGSARRLWQHADWKKGDVDVFFRDNTQRVNWLEEFDKVWDYTHSRSSNNSYILNSFDMLAPRSATPQRKSLPQASLQMETDNAMTFDLFYEDAHTQSIQSCKLQVIKVRQADSLHTLWQEFDFNLCCFAVDAQFVYADVAALQDLHNHQITPRNQSHNKNKPLRIMKHFSQGYHVNDELLLQAFQQIRDKDVDWCNNY